MKNKISVIVPTYNVEKYIRKCLDSLVIQDYDDYDVLVINDGSPANEQVIIDEYQQKYPAVIKGIRKENGGYGSVLELGFRESDADYVLICDPDDYLAPHALSTLMKLKEESGADLVVGAKNLVYDDSEEVKYDPSFNPEFGAIEDGRVYRKEEKGFERFYFLEPSPHAKLYKRELVSEITFPHKVSYTDNLLYFYTLSRVNSVVYCAEPLSYYLINRAGNTRTDLKPTIIDAWVTVFKSIAEQCPEGSEIFWYRLFEAFYSIYYKVDQIKGDEKLKEEKYELIYTYLQELLPHKEAILKKNEEYQQDTSRMKAQKAKLLDPASSQKTYRSLYHKRLYGSLKQSVKNFVLNNAALSRLYGVYHFHAKYWYARNDERMILHPQVKCEALIDEGVNFFGYYDKPCVAYGHSLLHRVNSTSLSYDQKVDLLVDGKKVSETTTWNWQQGSMAAWVDETHILHNFFDGRAFRSKAVNILTGECREYCFPVYSLSKDKTFGLSLNFSRLAKLRKDYGYFNLPYQDLPANEEDGIWYVDLEKDEAQLWLTLAEIAAFCPREDMQGAVHKVNHIDISPDSKRAIFLHRWYVGKKKYTRLLCVDIATKELHLLADQDMVSHMAWVGSEKVFGYLRRKDGKDGYAFIDLEGKETVFDDPALVDDGHPTVYNERYIVTDTYPDYTCRSKLYLIDVQKHSVTKLGEFYSGKKYQDDRRCDLHPRFDKEGKSLTFDSVCREEQRRTYHLDLSELIEEERS
ncbi:MAG: glycosyltransferase family 2 protein [Erysipelotrichaceae bacterium]|nr:glycosyltransferase family 2 protein [Erysipelotrichaceae bacterium]